jgi:hypothetical protein
MLDIKLVRDRFGIGLPEAKDLVDRMYDMSFVHTSDDVPPVAPSTYNCFDNDAVFLGQRFGLEYETVEPILKKLYSSHYDLQAKQKQAEARKAIIMAVVNGLSPQQLHELVDLAASGKLVA